MASELSGNCGELERDYPSTDCDAQAAKQLESYDYDEIDAKTKSDGGTVLTKLQRAQIERNRQRALLVREAINNKRGTKEVPAAVVKGPVSPSKISRKVVDTGGGFLLEEEEPVLSKQLKIVHEPGPSVGSSCQVCEDCSKDFCESYLFSKFSRPICDNCKDLTDKHRLVTRTEAKEKYLLKDSDLDRREPILPFIVKKNPHNERWGDMKLYLECQVAELAEIVWGSDEALDKVKADRQANKEVAKKKKFDKKVKELRRTVRGSMYKKATAGHEHEFAEEVYNEDEDTYSKTCKTCQHLVTYEKM